MSNLPKPRAGHVYVIGHAGGKAFKIGYSRKPVKRLSTLRMATPDRLDIAFSLRCQNPCDVEQKAHLLLRHRRIRGEWFKAANAFVPELAVRAAAGNELAMRMFMVADPFYHGEGTLTRMEMADHAYELERLMPGVLKAVNTWDELHLDDAYEQGYPRLPSVLNPPAPFCGSEA